MPRISRHLIVTVPAGRAWDVLGHHFHRIGDWATTITDSRPLTGPGPLPDAPAAGRVCQTGIGLMPEVTERLIAYDEAGQEFTYQAEPLPWFLAEARNHWRVEALGPHHSRIHIDVTVRARGPLGPLLYLVLRLQLARTIPQFLDDLAHYLQTGQPSPRKRRAVRTQPPISGKPGEENAR
jgi:hypothetical protein